MRSESGQALLEVVLGSSLSLVVLAGAGCLFKAQWDRVRCAHQAFEAAHAALVGARSSHGALAWTTITEGPRSVRASQRCGRVRETVELPRLEHAGW